MSSLNWRRSLLSMSAISTILLTGAVAARANPTSVETETNPVLACLKAEGKAIALSNYYGANSATGRAWFVAANLCSRQLTRVETVLYKQLTRRCDRAYQDRQGTMYITFHGSCYFKAYEYVNSLDVGIDPDED